MTDKPPRSRKELATYLWVFAVSVGLTIAVFVSVNASDLASSRSTQTCDAMQSMIVYLRGRSADLHHPPFTFALSCEGGTHVRRP